MGNGLETLSSSSFSGFPGLNLIIFPFEESVDA
jgi:hypothetical protein